MSHGMPPRLTPSVPPSTRSVVAAVLTAFLFLRSTAGSFWSVENRFFLHWQRSDTLGVLGAILVVGLGFYIAGWALSRCGRIGRWLRDAAFVFIVLQYARVNLAESLEAAGWLWPWARRGLQGLHLLFLMVFVIRRSAVVRLLCNGCLMASPILAIYAWTLLTAATYSPPSDLRYLTSDFRSPTSDLGPPSSETARRIVLIVFDEWSYARVFDAAGGVLPEYPELARITESAIVFSAAHSPGTETLISLPAIIAGTSGVSRIASDGMLWFGPQGDERAFNQRTTVFSDFRERGYRNVMIGNYLPYADLVGHETDICRAYDLYRVMGTSPLALCGSLVIENFRIRLSFLHAAFGWPFHYAKNRYFARMAGSLHNQTLSMIKSPGSLFAMVHHSLPHMPFIFDRNGPRKQLHFAATLDLDDYRGNLRYTDRLIGELRDAARAQPDGGPLLVLTGDHGFRQDPMWDGLPHAAAQQGRRHVPLIVLPPGATVGRVIKTSFELTDLRGLLVRWADTGELPVAE